MEKKRLTRSRTDRKISGICGGIAEYLNVDSTIVRLIAVVGMIASFSLVFWVYIVAIFVIPEEA